METSPRVGADCIREKVFRNRMLKYVNNTPLAIIVTSPWQIFRINFRTLCVGMFSSLADCLVRVAASLLFIFTIQKL